MADSPVPGADELRARFDAQTPLTVGLEEEVMLLDPSSLDLAPLAGELLERIGDDERFKGELPAAHLELVTRPHDSVAGAVAELAAARHGLAGAADGLARIAAAGLHPFAAVEGELNSGPRYDHTRAEFGCVARRQLVASLQVHVAVGGAERTLAVYNALRSYLPEIAALAANAAFYAGRDTGMASARPLVSTLLPRQGVPPALESWDQFADALEWGRRAGSVPDPGFWWWELRPHTVHGTLEIRVPDTQATIDDASAVAAFTHCLVAWLSARHDAGEHLRAHDDWRIEENRWSAMRHGVDGTMADLDTGEPTPTHARVAGLIEAVSAHDRDGLLGASRRLLASPPATRQRHAAREDGPRGVVKWLADSYLPPDL